MAPGLTTDHGQGWSACTPEPAEIDVKQRQRLEIERPRAGHRGGDPEREHGSLAEADVEAVGQVHEVRRPRRVVRVKRVPVIQRGIDVDLERRRDRGDEPGRIGASVEEVDQAHVVVHHRHLILIDRESRTPRSRGDRIFPCSRCSRGTAGTGRCGGS